MFFSERTKNPRIQEISGICLEVTTFLEFLVFPRDYSCFLNFSRISLFVCWKTKKPLENIICSMNNQDFLWFSLVFTRKHRFHFLAKKARFPGELKQKKNPLGNQESKLFTTSGLLPKKYWILKVLLCLGSNPRKL